MKNLIHFLQKYSVVFLFFFLEIIALVLISNNKGYQRSVLLSSTNVVAGWMFEQSSELIDFFKLKEVNAGLAEENTALKNRVTLLENRLAATTDTTYTADWKKLSVAPEREYAYIPAKVIRNTTHLTQNYITLNKGSQQGIRPDMGVVSDAGVVGIVQTVSDRFAVVIPILNPQAIISAKFKRSNYFGPLAWDGKDYRYATLNDIARHVKFNRGDTLVTSGLVKTFPEGVLVGTVNRFDLKESDAYYRIQVKLAVDFRTLTHVKVIRYLHYDEQMQIEQKTTSNKSTGQ